MYIVGERTFGRQVDTAIVHVAGDAVSIDGLKKQLVLIEHRDVAAGIYAPADLTAFRLVVGRISAVVGDIAQNAGKLEMTPVSTGIEMRRQIRQFFVVLQIGAEFRIELAQRAG